MKKTLLIIASAAMLGSSSLFAQASNCPAEGATPCCKRQTQCRQQKPRRMKQGESAKFRQKPNRPQMKLSPEQKAEFELFRKTLEAYRKDPTPENKAKLAELISKKLDKTVAMNKKRAEFMRKSADNLEKRNAEIQANREAEIDKMIERLMNPPKRKTPHAPNKK